MKLLLFSSFVLVLAACGPAAGKTPTIKLAKGTATLDVTVTKVKVGKGSLFCALFNAADGFPGASPIIGGTIENDTTADKRPCTYANLPAGDYALTVYQDENADGIMNTNNFGKPTEGYGATNNILPEAAPPTFEASKIHLDDGQTVAATVNLK